ncbi:MAG: acyl-CoA thioesterase [Vicinamibacteria bacterium]
MPGVRRRARVADDAAKPFWPVTVEIKVPWRDIDGAGHVNNAVYFSYMETCRAEAYLRMRGGTRMQDLDIILARATCDYRSPAEFGETLVVEARPLRVGGTSFTLGYAIREKTTGRLVAEGESVQVAFDYATQSKKPIPEGVRAKLEAGLT